MQLEVKVGKEIHKNQDNNLNNFIIKKEKGSDIKDIKNNNDKIDNNNIDNDKKSNDDYKFKRNLKNNTILSHFKITKKSNSSKMKYDDIINKLSRDSFSIYHDQSYHKLEKEQINEFKIKLLDWFDENKRKLPWRVNLENDTTDELKNLNAYKVWVSEIMLQQTQVETVKEYFIKWIKLFPTIESLALADIEKVNIAWAGLGYYQRAKRLHDGAKLVVDKFSGKIPNNLNDLLSLPGIGPYTAGAIASIAFGLPCETVDGNIMRVITRIYAISGDIRAQSTVTILWEKAKELLNKERPGDFNQAYMDFGSSVCTSTNPKCNICPFSGKDGNKPICKAYLESQIELPDLLDLEDLEKLYDIPSHRECNMCTEIPNGEKGIILFPVTRYPYKSPNKKKRDEECIVLVIKKIDKGNKSNFLMIKRPNKGLLAGMWAFPYIDISTKEATNKISKKGQSRAKKYPKGDIDFEHSKELEALYNRFIRNQSMYDIYDKIKYHGPVSHIFSHINQIYHVYSITIDEVESGVNEDKIKWVDHPNIVSLPTAFSKVWKKTNFENQ